MRVGAVLIAHALGALAPEVDGFERAVKIADTMSKATLKMVAGVEHFLKEAEAGKADRAAHAFVAGNSKQAIANELTDAEMKGSHLAQQVLRNIKALSSAAEALQAEVRDLPKPKPAAAADAGQDGYTARLEAEIAALRKTNSEIEDEKRSLVTSVATLMHNGAGVEMKQQIADAKEHVVQLEDGAKEALGRASATEQQLRSDNALCTESLTTCQAEQKDQQAGKVQQSIEISDVKCNSELAEATKRLNAVESEHSNMVQTVQMMVKNGDELKAKLAQQAGQNCTQVKYVPPAASAPAPTIDIAHMGETVKMDQYIARSMEPEEPIPAPVKKAAPVKVAKVEKPEPVETEPAPKQVLAATKEANQAMAGKGEIGKYLRGNSKEAKAEDDDLEVQIDAMMPADEAVQMPKKSKGKAPPQDDLAQKLLLQAEKNLKLAAM